MGAKLSERVGAELRGSLGEGCLVFLVFKIVKKTL
jgi:hypothetical protein